MKTKFCRAALAGEATEAVATRGVDLHTVVATSAVSRRCPSGGMPRERDPPHVQNPRAGKCWGAFEDLRVGC